jgi:hypothetical protein
MIIDIPTIEDSGMVIDSPSASEEGDVTIVE